MIGKFIFAFFPLINANFINITDIINHNERKLLTQDEVDILNNAFNEVENKQQPYRVNYPLPPQRVGNDRV